MTHDAITNMLNDGGPLLRVPVAAAIDGITIGSRTAIRWWTHGRQGIKLPTVKVGGCRRTTVAALRRWLAEVAQAEDRGRVAPAPAIDTKAADDVLAAFGLGREVAQ